MANNARKANKVETAEVQTIAPESAMAAAVVEIPVANDGLEPEKVETAEVQAIAPESAMAAAVVEVPVANDGLEPEKVETAEVQAIAPESAMAAAVVEIPMVNKRQAIFEDVLTQIQNLSFSEILKLKEVSDQIINKDVQEHVNELTGKIDELKAQHAKQNEELKAIQAKELEPFIAQRNELILKMGGKLPKGEKASKPERPVRPPMFQYDGNTWHGKGKYPEWLTKVINELGIADDKDKRHEFMNSIRIPEQQ